MQVKCPECQSVEKQDHCLECGCDLKWVHEAYIKSQHYYHKGYSNAKERNFKAALHNLERAIVFNKYNVNARNLLGLIHFEVGQIGEALKLWILSTSISKEENIAKDYIEDLHRNPKKLEDYKESIKLYNRALNYLRNKNEDVAIIRLKKAIYLNPKFVEAKNLLAASYMVQNQYDKAFTQIQQTLEIDSLNEKALKYLSILEKNKGSENVENKNIIDAPNLNQANAYYIGSPQKVINRGSMLGKYMMYFVLGVLCMLGVQVGLIVPSKTNELEQKNYILTNENSDLKVQIDTFTDSYRKEILELEKENSALVEDKSSLQNELLLTEQARRILKSELYMEQGKWVESADVLNNISETSLNTEQKQQYVTLRDQVFKKAGDALYKKGYNDFWSERYTEADSVFEKVVIYIPTTSQAANAMYYRGEIAEKNNDIARAIEFYQGVVAGYENSSAAGKAKRRLDKLQ